MSDAAAAASTPPATIANFAEIVARRSAEAESRSTPRESASSDSEHTTDDGMKVTDLPRPKKPEQQQATDDAPEYEGEVEYDEEPELDPTRPPEPAEPDPDAEIGKLLAAARKSGEPLKADVLDKLDGLMVAVPTKGGPDRLVPINDLVHGHLRQAKLTRELEKTYQVRSQSEHILQLERQRRQEWQNHAVLERDLKTMVHPDVLHAWHMQWAEQRYNYMKAPPEQRAMWDQMQQIEAARAREQAELQQLRMWQQQQQQQQVDPATADSQRMIESNMDRSLTEAFRAAKFQFIKVNDQNRGLWLQHLRYACDGGPVTVQACRQAAQAVVDDLREQGAAAFEAERAAAAKRPQEVPPRRAPAGPPPNRDSNGQFAPRQSRSKGPRTAAAFRAKFLGE